MLKTQCGRFLLDRAAHQGAGWARMLVVGVPRPAGQAAAIVCIIGPAGVGPVGQNNRSWIHER